MPTFERCPSEVNELALAVLGKYEDHKPLLNGKVKIDYVFAYCDRDEKTDEPLNFALTKNGVQALGIARAVPTKDRALGRGDAEIALDGDHWQRISESMRLALLDHELHHLAVNVNKAGVLVTDSIGRPKVSLRKHDVEVGWFNLIASRHGNNSIERRQAKRGPLDK